MSPSAKVFHYGQAVFEGMKAYKDDNGEVFLFRPDENQARINKSSKRMAIPEFPKKAIF
jgi:branched-chain amino acid aminotransferase